MHPTVLLALLLGCAVDAVTDPPRDEVPPPSQHTLPLDPTPHQLEGEPVPFPASLALQAAFNEGVVDAAAGPQAGPFSIARNESHMGHGSNLAVAPSGDRLVIIRDRPAVLSMKTGEILAELPRAPGCINPSWSGNGAAIAMWCVPEGSAGEATPPPDELRIWEPDTGRTRIVGLVAGRQNPLSWMEPVSAWWVTDGVENLASLVSFEGEVRGLPHGEGLLAASIPHVRRKLSWSHDGRHGFVLAIPPEAPSSLHLAPMSWVDGQLSLGEATEIHGDMALALRVLPDGRALVKTARDPYQVLGPDGEPQWTGQARLPEILQAVAARTGRCPTTSPRVRHHTPRIASSDGRWVASHTGLEHTLDGRSPPVPIESYQPPPQVHTELPGGRWLVTLRRDLYLLDAVNGRATWALKGGRVLAAEGTSVLVTTDGDSVTLLDFETREARTTAVQSATAAADGAWLVRADGTLQRVRGDGTVTHQGSAGPPGDPPKAPTEELFDWYMWRPQVLEGRALLTFLGTQPLAYRIGPERRWFGWYETQASCGVGQTPPALGWADEHSLHVLDDQGHEHVLRYDEALVDDAPADLAVWREQLSNPNNVLDVLTAGLGISASLRKPATWGDGAHLQWELPHPVAATLSARSAQPAGAPPLDLHALSGDGWVLLRPDGSASGRDRRASVLRQEGDSKARASPLYVPDQPWTAPPPVELGPCPWDH